MGTYLSCWGEGVVGRNGVALWVEKQDGDGTVFLGANTVNQYIRLYVGITVSLALGG